MNTSTSRAVAVRGVVLLVVALAVLSTLTGSVVAEPATTSIDGPDSVATGEPATVEVSITNTGSNPSSFIGELVVPANWTVTEETNQGAIWNAEDQTWLWQSIDAGASVTPSATVAIPQNASTGSYDIDIVVKSDEGIEANATHTVTVERSGQADDSATTEETDSNTETDDGIPGFGVLAAIAALSGTAFVARWRSRNS